MSLEHESKPKVAQGENDNLSTLLKHLHPSGSDPTYAVLKAHLVAEEVLYEFLKNRAQHPESIDKARLGFAQVLNLARAFHRNEPHDWWVWISLEKLNSLRNLMAHNLVAVEAQNKIKDFSVYVATILSGKKDPALNEEYVSLVKSGVHPFLLALVAMHLELCISLDFDSKLALAESAKWKVILNK